MECGMSDETCLEFRVVGTPSWAGPSIEDLASWEIAWDGLGFAYGFSPTSRYKSAVFETDRSTCVPPQQASPGHIRARGLGQTRWSGHGWTKALARL